MCPTSGINSTTFLITSCRTESANSSSIGISDLYLVIKRPRYCLTRGSCLQLPKVTISPTHGDLIHSTMASQQPHTKPHTREVQTSFSVCLHLQLPQCTVSVHEKRQAWWLCWLSQRGQLAEVAACSQVEKVGFIISFPTNLNVQFHFGYREREKK